MYGAGERTSGTQCRASRSRPTPERMSVERCGADERTTRTRMSLQQTHSRPVPLKRADHRSGAPGLGTTGLKAPGLDGPDLGGPGLGAHGRSETSKCGSVPASQTGKRGNQTGQTGVAARPASVEACRPTVAPGTGGRRPKHNRRQEGQTAMAERPGHSEWQQDPAAIAERPCHNKW